ncbi:hypothetical protein [Vibrio phage PhiImVa-1]|nr:hypothetical protein [Vibrio phage PhiImVa-1]
MLFIPTYYQFWDGTTTPRDDVINFSYGDHMYDIHPGLEGIGIDVYWEWAKDNIDVAYLCVRVRDEIASNM